MKQIDADALKTAKQRSSVAFAIVESLRAGEIAIVPIEQGYVLIADIFSETGIAKIKEVKALGADIYLPILVSSVDQISPYCGPITPEQRLLALEFWPGPLMMEVSLPQGALVNLGAQFAPDALYFRAAGNELVRELCELMGGVVYSPIIKEGAPVNKLTSIDKKYRDSASYLVQGKKFTPEQRPTIVRFSINEIALARTGDIDEMRIRRILPQLKGS